MHAHDDDGAETGYDGAEPDLDLVEYVVISVPEPVLGRRCRRRAQAARRVRADPDPRPGRRGHRRGRAAHGRRAGAVVRPGGPRQRRGRGGRPAERGRHRPRERRLQPGTSALIVVVEDRWAQLLADAARDGGGRIIGGERIPRHRLEQSRRSRRPHRCRTEQEDSREARRLLPPASRRPAAAPSRAGRRAGRTRRGPRRPTGRPGARAAAPRRTGRAVGGGVRARRRRKVFRRPPRP